MTPLHSIVLSTSVGMAQPAPGADLEDPRSVPNVDTAASTGSTTANQAPAPEQGTSPDQAPVPGQAPASEPTTGAPKQPAPPSDPESSSTAPPQPAAPAVTSESATGVDASVSTPEGESTVAVAASSPPPSPPSTVDEAGQGGGLSFSPGVQTFLRGEGRLNPDFDANGGAADLGQVLERVRIQAHAKWGPVSGFVQVQDARTWGFEGSTVSNEANTDLHQGWGQVGGERGKLSGYVRAGRQEIAIGKQRLIGPLAWMPNARSFDALALHGAYGNYSLDGFLAIMQPMGTVTEPDPTDPTAPDLTADSQGAQLAGLWFGARPHKAINAEILGLVLRNDGQNGNINFERTLGNVGARLWGEPLDGLTYDAEANVQFGDNNGRDHLAWAWAADLQYVHKKLKRVKPGAAVGYAMGSGEECVNAPGDPAGCGAAESTEFFNFFPTNHLHYGFVDLLGWRNMRNLEAQVFVGIPKIAKKIGVKYHFFQLQEAAGRWSNAGGANVGVGWDETNTDNNLGHEIDIFAVFKPWEPLFIQPGYGVFLPTGAGKTLGGDDPQHYLWLWMVFEFDARFGPKKG